MSSTEANTAPPGDETPSPSSFSIGQRIRSEDGHIGTIRYIGEVATSKRADAVWIGIEWDEEGRGKHDGSVTTEDGVNHRYFTCPDGFGSFIKPKRARPGVDLVQMVLERYNTQDLDEIVNEQEQISAESNYKVEFVGWDRAYRRQCKLDTKTRIILDNEYADRMADPNELAQMIPHVQLLDLRRNLFRSMSDLRGLNVLSHLVELNLSHNRLDLSEFDLEAFGDSFCRMEILKLNDIPNAWHYVYHLASAGHLPRLTELQICDTGIENFLLDGIEIPSRFDCFPNLSNLNMSANLVSDWNEISRFGSCPNLTDLNVSYNRLEWIPFVENCFETLRVFWFRNNVVSDLRVFDEMNKYVSIEQLLFINNPMADGLGDSRVRDLAIAKVERMVKCNQSEVGSKERLDSEMFYLKWIQQELEKEEKGGDDDDEKERSASQFELAPEEIEQRYPRYMELVRRHGFTKVKRNEKQGLAMALVSIKSMDPESCTAPRKEKRLPLSMTVGQLKLLCRRFFQLDPEMQRLQMRPAGKGFPEDLGDDTRTLAFYGIKDGCEILMQSNNFER